MQVLPQSRVPIGVPSPTLTNPEMILPDISPSTGSSPSTPWQHQRLPSPPSLRSVRHVRSESAPDEKSRIKGAMYSPFRNGVLRRHNGSMTRRSSSERGDHRNAFEKNPLSQQGGDVPFASSPTLYEDPSGFGRRIYTESTHGDYENGEGTYSTPAILEEDENDPYSHAAMTRRAEEILASAKKRLTNMEGNLNRARSTLGARSSSSMSSFGTRSPEPASLYTLPGTGRNPSGFAPSNHRQAYIPSPDEAKQVHSRVFSETTIPSSLQTRLPNGHSTGGDRGESNGSGIIGTDANPPDRHLEPSRKWFWNGLARNTSLIHANRHANGLQALNEDGPATESFEQRAAREHVIEEERSIDLQSATAAAFDAKNPPTMGLTRARSTTQMHDLREQMQDLKGKISTLKQRAKEDNLRRRSMQSLRTPSPFTAAEQWYTGTPSPEDIGREPASGPGLIRDAQGPHSSKDRNSNVPQDSGHASTEERVTKDHDEILDDAATLGKDPLHELLEKNDDAVKDLPEGEVHPVDSLSSQKECLVLVDEPPADEVILDHDNAAVVEGHIAIEPETKEDSLYGDEDYHETSTSPIITKHEDREDAFDYEHYILTSAMGSYTGIGVRRSSSMKKRSSSLRSESSVETTKPRNSMGDEAHLINGRHGRQDSIDSISTVNTFATANEVNDSDSSQDDRTPSKPTAPSGRPEPPKKHKPNGSNESAPDRLQSNGHPKHDGQKHIISAQKGYVNGLSCKPPPVTGNLVFGPQQPPDLLNVLSATSSWQEGAPPLHLDLGDRDKELVERLVRSLAKVCGQAHSSWPEGSIYEARVFRRKLDAARRVLDGEMNGEAF